jgi:NADH-quinone oxidoreductase subunit G
MTEQSTESRTVTLKINGVEYTVPANWSLIQACHNHGITVPHYCYHEDLSVAGNCRMCLVQIAGMPKPVIACGTPVNEGMEVDTLSPAVEREREAMMEFLLINHPLDCPECDQAGECRLQDYSYEYGRDQGRFQEEKVVRRKSTLGPHVKYWGSRCIVCTRCVRFTDEVTGTGELSVANRGDHSEIVVFPGQSLDNPLSMNTVDICPVGALVSADFLYRSRVWNMTSKESICASCSVGCNTRVDSDKQNQIKRVKPRRNNAVNKEWMCDFGRLDFEYVYTDKRLNLCKTRATPGERWRELPWKEAYKTIAGRIFDSNTVYLVSYWNTTELFERIADELNQVPNARIAGFGKARVEDQVFPGFTISGDKNPNRRGFDEIFANSAVALADLAAESARIKNLVVISNVPDFALTDELSAILDHADRITVLDFYESEFVQHAAVDLAVATLTHFEKAGSFLNRQGLRQPFKAAIEAASFGRSTMEIIDRVKELRVHAR